MMSAQRELSVVEAAERLIAAAGGHVPESIAHELATLDAAVEAYRLDEHYREEAQAEAEYTHERDNGGGDEDDPEPNW